MSEKLSPKLIELAASMLEDYAKVLGSAGCNDWEFPESWTESERQEFGRGESAWNGDPEEFDPDYPEPPDFSVAGYLAHLLRAHA